MPKKRSVLEIDTLSLAIDIVFVMMASIFVLSMVTIDLDSIRPPKSFLEKEKFTPEEGVSVRIDANSSIYIAKENTPLGGVVQKLERDNPKFVQIVADRRAEARQVKALIDVVIENYATYLIYLPQ